MLAAKTLQRSSIVRQLLCNFKSLNQLMATWQQYLWQLWRYPQSHIHTQTHARARTETHFFMLKKDHRRHDVPSPGSPAQCVPVHFHRVVPAEHGVAFSPALWDTSLPFLSPHVCVCACVRACQAPPSRALSGVNSLFQGLQHGLATVGLCGRLRWMRPRDSTRIPPFQAPKAHLLRSAGLPREVPRSPSLLLLLFSFLLFL